MKQWVVGKPDVMLAMDFKKKCDLSMLVLKLLTARGFTEFSQVVDFFTVTELESPFKIKDMQKAVDTVNEFIDSGELVCIYGDYDCDGITATLILYSYLENMGANVIYHINERSQGYGMNEESVRELCKKGVKLIVTVDNGITCINEIKLAYELGMRVVVTDHHEPLETLPDAEAVVDPHRKDCPSSYKDIAGVGVALKVCAALDDGNYDFIMEQYADICSIGTVGDLVSLDGENRTLVKNGLAYMKNSENYGINELIDQSGVKREKLRSSTLSFQICPRINAAGRFASPLLALEALLTEDPDEAKQKVSQLVAYNDERKKIESEILSEVSEYIDTHPDVLNRRVPIIAGKGWHHGVVGLVSARFIEKYGKPNIIISIDDDGIARGSARSIEGFNIFECLSYASVCLDKFGGHECAGGLTVREERLDELDRLVQSFAAKYDYMPSATVKCDMVLDEQDLTVDSVKTLDLLQPCGAGNPQPLFMLPSCRINAIYPLSGGKHTKLDVTYGKTRVGILVFQKSPSDMFFKIGDIIDIAANVDINEYNGKVSVSIKAADIIPHGFDTNKYFAAKDCYEKLMRSESVPKSYLSHVCPERKHMIYVYNLLRQTGECDIDTLIMKINHPAFNYCRVKVIIDAFCQTGLAEFVPSSQKVRLIKPTKKADMESAQIIKKLKTMYTI